MCAQSCLTLCDPMDCSLPSSSVHRISNALSFFFLRSLTLSKLRKCIVYVKWHLLFIHACLLSCSVMSDSLQPYAYKVPLPLEFSREESWSELPFPASRDLPNPGVPATSLASPTLAGRLFTTAPPEKCLTF